METRRNEAFKRPALPSRYAMKQRYPHIPGVALAVTQPWAWALVHGGKPVENRDWKAWNRDLKFRGPFAIHASSGMTRDDYEEGAGFMAGMGVACPKPNELLRGGIIGVSRIVDVVTAHHSPWFFGPYGLVLADTKPVAFVSVKGMLGFFEWANTEGGKPVEPARWMLNWSPDHD